MEMEAQVKKLIVEHIRNHTNYPATKVQLEEACNRMEECSDEQKQWFAKELPNRTFRNANEVIKALRL